MNKITVYRYKVWDPGKWQLVSPPMMASRETISIHIKGEILEDTALEIDQELLDGNGMTPIETIQ